MTGMRFYIRARDMRDECRALNMEYGVRIYGLVVEHVAIAQKAATNSRREHSHPAYHLLIYTGGEGLFMFGAKARRCAPGVIALAAPGRTAFIRNYRRGLCFLPRDHLLFHQER